MEFSWNFHIIITTVLVVHHTLPEEHHIGLVAVLEAVVLVGHGADDFPLAHLVRLALQYCHKGHLTSLHNAQAEDLEALHSRQDHLDRSWEEAGIVGIVEEDALSHNLVGVGFHHMEGSKVVVDRCYTEAVARLKAVDRHMKMVGLKVCRRMAVGWKPDHRKTVDLKVRRRREVD